MKALLLLVLLAWLSTTLRAAGPNPPGVIFTCDFESPTWWQEWAAREKDVHTDTVADDPKRKFEPHRGKALRIRVDQGGHYGVSLDFNFKKRTGVEPEEIFFRYYVRLADDWKPERGGKLPGLGGNRRRGHQSPAHRAAARWTMTGCSRPVVGAFPLRRITPARAYRALNLERAIEAVRCLRLNGLG